ncbi:exoribonuclease II [Paraphotobacterium marinum]|uniref:exoribonuclease II n=1 Tax=Paraphotobacterium marinum TaxID=1755811 RepID=UPI0039E83A30
MLQDNPLLNKLKKELEESLPKKTGTVKAHVKGFGFLETEKKEKIFLSQKFMKQLINGDKIEAIIREQDKKKYAEPIKLISSELESFTGTAIKKNNKFFIVPDNALINHHFKIEESNIIDMKENETFLCNFSQHKMNNKTSFNCKVQFKVAESDDIFKKWKSALANLNLPFHGPNEQEVSFALNDEKLIDLTEKPFVTIDGPDTKDIDDALYIEKASNNSYKLTIAIADPTSYFEHESTLDEEARVRISTIYLPGMNVPMLPKKLSEEICSLRPHQKKSTLCCEVIIDENGQINKDVHFFMAWIKSQGQLSYEQVFEFLQNKTNLPTSNPLVEQQLQLLELFCQKRLSYRHKNEILFKDQNEYKFELNEDNSVKNIKTESKNIAHKIVEEAMIVANQVAGHFLATKLNKGIFNTNSGLDMAKRTEIESLFKKLNINFFDNNNENLTIENYKNYREWLDEQPGYIKKRLRKFNAHTSLSTDPGSHYGMGIQNYATWTSPIRKYSDLLNHRLIKSIISVDKPIEELNSDFLDASILKRKLHRFAEREINNFLYANFLKNHKLNNTIFKAEVFDVTKAGLRLKLIENGASVFLPANSIDNKIKFNNELFQLKSNECTFDIGQVLKVSILDINDENYNITVKLIK